MMKRRILALLLTAAMALSMFCICAHADGGVDLSKCELRFDGESWHVYTVENIDEGLTEEQLNITVVDENGDPVDPSMYTILLGAENGFDENNHMLLKRVDPPYKVLDPQEGLSTYGAFAIPSDANSIKNASETQSFMIWHKYSFNWFGANAEFGEQYKKQCTWSWHDYFEIPANRIEEPVVHGIDYSDPDPSCYKLTYFRRVTGVPVSDDDDYQEKVYPENEPLEGLPKEEGAYFVRIDGKDPYYGTSYIDFNVTEAVPENDFAEDVEIRFRGKEEWAEDYLLSDKNEKLSLDDLAVTVVKKNGDLLDPSLYDLSFGYEAGYNDELHEPIIVNVEPPLGLDASPDGMNNGWVMFSVVATAKENSGYEGSTRRYEFMVRDSHTLQRDSATIDFGAQYLTRRFWSWHCYYEIPEDKFAAPKVYDAAGNLLTEGRDYTLTYFCSSDNEEDHYPETDPLAGIPTEPGQYFVRLDGKGDYYGVSYADFAIITPPESYAMVRGEFDRYHEGDTISLRVDGEIYVCFDLDPYNGLIPGWRNDLLAQQGFEIDDDPTFFRYDDYAYAHIKAGSKNVGDTGTLEYNWYRFEDVIGEHAVGWKDAVPVYSSSVNIEVTLPEDEDLNILGDTDGDRDVTILDATAIQRHLVNLPTVGFIMLCADSDRDGEVTILDATAIQRKIAGYPEHEEIGEDLSYGTYYALWNIEQDLLPAGSTLTGADAERAREEIRRALTLLIDRGYITREIVPVKRLPASTFVSKWITDADGSEFHYSAGNGEGIGYFKSDAFEENRNEAIAILKKYYPYNETSKKFSGVPALTYIYNTSGVHSGIANKIAADFAEVGITVNTQGKDWGTYEDTLAEKNFSLARSGWVIEVDKPMGFLETWTSESRDNSIGFGQGSYRDAAVYSLDLTPYGFDIKVENGTWAETYDVLIDVIYSIKDKALAYQLMHLAEDMLMTTGCIVPIYYY